MSKPKILVQLDTDPQPSVFDSVVAIDAGVDHLLCYHGVTPENVRQHVHGAMFTRSPGDLCNTALFIGGSDVAVGEAVMQAVARTFFGPMRVSVMLDSSGANTTAAAAVLAAGGHLGLGKCSALVLAATGPVGRRVARLLARQGAAVAAASRTRARAEEVCREVAAAVPGARVRACGTASVTELEAALEGVELVIAAGAAGVELLPADVRRNCATLRVAIDLNAVAPAGIGGIDVMDRAVDHSGVVCYGAIGVGGTKMKIHKAAIRRLFERNDLALDAEELFELGAKL